MFDTSIEKLLREIGGLENIDTLVVLRQSIEKRRNLRAPDKAILYEACFVRKNYILQRYPEQAKMYLARKP